MKNPLMNEYQYSSPDLGCSSGYILPVVRKLLDPLPANIVIATSVAATAHYWRNSVKMVGSYMVSRCLSRVWMRVEKHIRISTLTVQTLQPISGRMLLLGGVTW